MTGPPTNPLDHWLRTATGLADPDPSAVARWQMARVRGVAATARTGSPFYRERLAGVDPESIRAPEDMARLPRLAADDLRNRPERLLCVSQDEVARAVTLESSGTTGAGKRLFFADQDLERMVDYFHHGMRLLMKPGQTALIFLPGERPDSVGLLLAEAVSRLGGAGLVNGPLTDPKAALETIRDRSVACLAGPPAQLNVLAAHWAAQGLGPGDSPVRSALFCWDASADAVRHNLMLAFGCRVHRHWGMVETGLGGAVECAEGSGPHLREADLYVEIADPDTGRPLPDGHWGEITVTTLRNRAMPLVRYRTGDLGRILAGACACGSPMRRLDPRIRRLEAATVAGADLNGLNEALYGLPGLADFTAETGPDRTALTLRVCAAGDREGLAERVRKAVDALGDIKKMKDSGRFQVAVHVLSSPGPAEPGLAKRRLTVKEKP